MHEVLVNRLGGLSLPRKSVVRLTDQPDMTLDVFHGRKTTTQQQQQPKFSFLALEHLSQLCHQNFFQALPQLAVTVFVVSLQILTCLQLAVLNEAWYYTGVGSGVNAASSFFIWPPFVTVHLYDRQNWHFVEILCLTHCLLVDSSIVIYWTSLFVILGVLDLFCLFDGKSCYQTLSFQHCRP